MHTCIFSFAHASMSEKCEALISNIDISTVVWLVMCLHTLTYVDMNPKTLPANLYNALLTNAICILIFRPLNITSWSVRIIA